MSKIASLFKKRSSDDRDERESAMNISGPTNVTHDCHVGFDTEKGTFIGLPMAWAQWLQEANISAAEQRQNPSAVMDALHVFDKKLREPIGQKYMGARSTEDLTAEADPKQQSKNVTMNDANGLPVLPAKARDADKDKLSDKPKQPSEKTAKHGDIVGEASVKRQKPQAAKKKMTDAEIHAALQKLVSREDPNRKYVVKKRVGSGASGIVCESSNVYTGELVAIKKMDLDHQPKKELIITEIEVMHESQHPNIVNYIESFLVGKLTKFNRQVSSEFSMPKIIKIGSFLTELFKE